MRDKTVDRKMSQVSVSMRKSRGRGGRKSKRNAGGRRGARGDSITDRTHTNTHKTKKSKKTNTHTMLCTKR
jgi:hypothetical protein